MERTKASHGAKLTVAAIFESLRPNYAWTERCSTSFGHGSLSGYEHGEPILSRAPAAHPEVTERPAVHSKTTRGRAPAARSKTTGCRAPAAGSKTTGCRAPAARSKTTGCRALVQQRLADSRRGGLVQQRLADSRRGALVQQRLADSRRGAWEHPVENPGKGGGALESIDSKNPGRVAQRKRCYRVFQQRAKEGAARMHRQTRRGRIWFGGGVANRRAVRMGPAQPTPTSRESQRRCNTQASTNASTTAGLPRNDTTPRSDEAVAKLAWTRTLDFFNKSLRG